MCIDADAPSLRIEQLAPGIEIATATGLITPFRPHQHDCYVVGLTASGVQSFRYRGAQRHALAGQAFAIHPGEVHDGRPGTDQSYGYRAAYIAPDVVSDALDGQAFPFVSEAVGRNARLLAALQDLLGLAPEDHDDITLTDGIAALADALVAMSDRRRVGGVPRDRQVALRLRDDIRAHAAEGRTMRDLEQAHGLDRFTICRLFRRHFGVGPKQYLLQRRVMTARSLMARGKTLADAACAAGFADQSHMTRHFIKTVGTSPGHWRQLAFGETSSHSLRSD